MYWINYMVLPSKICKVIEHTRFLLISVWFCMSLCPSIWHLNMNNTVMWTAIFGYYEKFASITGILIFFDIFCILSCLFRTVNFFSFSIFFEFVLFLWCLNFDGHFMDSLGVVLYLHILIFTYLIWCLYFSFLFFYSSFPHLLHFLS